MLISKKTKKNKYSRKLRLPDLVQEHKCVIKAFTDVIDNKGTYTIHQKCNSKIVF
jgi:hypothetical protein